MSDKDKLISKKLEKAFKKIAKNIIAKTKKITVISSLPIKTAKSKKSPPKTFSLI